LAGQGATGRNPLANPKQMGKKAILCKQNNCEIHAINPTTFLTVGHLMGAWGIKNGHDIKQMLFAMPKCYNTIYHKYTD